MHILATCIFYFELIAFQVYIFSILGWDWERGPRSLARGLNKVVGSKLALEISRSRLRSTGTISLGS
ncbi:hypothetical protein ARMSODRAFT_963539 [Armillaria solidipes]|uniref:Uncharacterized protein n=1 Tax=Armillaria solidipes TaxID=1076256 RepID=A0A2H3AWD1_9AGAR|nr:hypothetical protein ARMSODRAFT_963539 [Armillaria solidipes]